MRTAPFRRIRVRLRKRAGASHILCVMRGPTRILEILRDFVEVDRLVRGLARRHRAHGLRFPELAALIRDDESSVLFRLKERTHALFRGPGSAMRGSTHREALFDLAVGSLFHEAMKLRENLYQREVYGPRVRELLRPKPARSRRRCSTSSRRCSARSTSGSTKACASSSNAGAADGRPAAAPDRRAE